MASGTEPASEHPALMIHEFRLAVAVKAGKTGRFAGINQKSLMANPFATNEWTEWNPETLKTLQNVSDEVSETRTHLKYCMSHR